MWSIVAEWKRRPSIHRQVWKSCKCRRSLKHKPGNEQDGLDEKRQEHAIECWPVRRRGSTGVESVISVLQKKNSNNYQRHPFQNCWDAIWLLLPCKSSPWVSRISRRLISSPNPKRNPSVLPCVNWPICAPFKNLHRVRMSSNWPTTEGRWLVFLSIRSETLFPKGHSWWRTVSFRLSRCLLAAADLGCLEDMLKLVSIMSVDTIFLNSSNLNEKMKMQRQKFVMNEGDHLTLLNVYKTFIANKKTKVNHLFLRLFVIRICPIRSGVKWIRSTEGIFFERVLYENNYDVFASNCNWRWNHVERNTLSFGKTEMSSTLVVCSKWFLLD